MIIETKYFGLHTYDDSEVITLNEGLYGFETAKQFLLLPFDKDDDSMMSLQCINRPEVAFVVFKPTVIDPTYSASLSAQEKKSLNLKSIRDLSFYVIAVVYDDFTETVANLKCPVAINTKENLALQVILDTKDYTFRHRVFAQVGGDV